MQKIMFSLCLSATMLLAACGGKCCDDPSKCTNPKCDHKAANATESGSNTAIAAAYDCPMHCKGAASDKPGVCPVCKMDLEATAK
jgi:Heavy metal binding domain